MLISILLQFKLRAGKITLFYLFFMDIFTLKYALEIMCSQNYRSFNSKANRKEILTNVG